ncbi:MAG: BMP family ABC transporter substrate-binding protein [Alphaproteobacteria bacterium]
MTAYRLIGTVLVVATLGVGTGASASAQVTIDGDPKVAFLYYSTTNDGGWTEALDRGRLKMQETLGIEAAYVENVEETSEAVRQAVEIYLSRGYNIVIGTSYGFGDGLKEMAADYPDVAFLNVAGETEAPNLETFYARTYQPWYLAGMAAGAMSESGVVGIVAGFPVSVVNWDVNAFARGAQSMNPEVEVIVAFLNTWYDPVKERQAAEAILEQGADVLATNMASTAPLVAAEEAGIWSIGFQNDMSAAAPTGHLTSVVFNWDTYFVPAVQAIAAGNWESRGLPLVGLDYGTADITALNPAVPADVVEQIVATRQAFIDGTATPFDGPVVKQDGTEVVAAGESLDDGGLWGMDYLVEGVTGTVPE